jgi:hypothetical protein
MFVERMFDFPAQKFGPKKSNTCSTRDEKRRVSWRESRARGLAGRSAGVRAASEREFSGRAAAAARGGGANFRGEFFGASLGIFYRVRPALASSEN